jgi:SPP1 family predicted phage head-tail adaptor
MLSAGRLDQRITLQVRATPATLNARGEDVSPWINWVTDGDGAVWASADPRRGSEHFAAQQMQVSGPVAFRIRYRAGVHERMRVLWRGVAYSIDAPPVDAYGMKESIELFCSTGGRDG